MSATERTNKLNLSAAKVLSLISAKPVPALIRSCASTFWSDSFAGQFGLRTVQATVATIMTMLNFRVAPRRGHQPRCGTCTQLPSAILSANAQGNVSLAEHYAAELNAHYNVVQAGRSLQGVLAAEAKSASQTGSSAPLVLLFDRLSTASIPHCSARPLERAGVPMSSVVVVHYVERCIEGSLHKA